MAPTFADMSGEYSDKPHNIVFVFGPAGGKPEAVVYFDRNLRYTVDWEKFGTGVDQVTEDFIIYCEKKNLPSLVLPLSYSLRSVAD